MCDYPKCANDGSFSDDECPGSDDENHHCVHCGELWWDDKGLNCRKCGDFYCPSKWQHSFKSFEDFQSHPKWKTFSRKQKKPIKECFADDEDCMVCDQCFEKMLSKLDRGSNTCDNSKCVNNEIFDEGICPGSGDECHHCAHCGELWWEVKGGYCAKCGDFVCPNVFKLFEDFQSHPKWKTATKKQKKSIEEFFDGEDHMVCDKCFKKMVSGMSRR